LVTKVRRRLRRSTMVAVAAQVVVVILVVGGALIPLEQRTIDSGPNLPPSIPEDYVLRITGSTLWDNVNKDLVHPVHIFDGGILKIRNSEVRMYLEDLAIEGDTFLKVFEGGSLQLENSTVTLVVDDRLSGAVILKNNYDIDPGLTRVVNLEWATSPTLELDVNWRASANVWILAQEDFHAPLKKVAKLTRGDDLDGRWEHFSIPLDDHVGKIVKLGIYPEYLDPDPNLGILVSGATVMDGGGELKGDLQFTGDPVEDGWHRDNSRILSSYSRVSKWARVPLIDCAGTLQVRDSTLTAPPTVPRGHQLSYDWSMVSASPLKTGSVLLDGAVTGGHLLVSGGALEIERSNISDVPIIATSANIHVSQSELSGVTELVTLFDVYGTIESTELTGVSSEPGERSDCLGKARLPPRQNWGIGVEGNSTIGTLGLYDCVFNGQGTALSLLDASAVVEGNEFKGVEGIAIWEHSTDGAPPTENHWKLNTFSNVKGSRYIATTSATVWAWYDPSNLINPRDDHLAITVPHLPYDEMIQASYDSVLLAMPRYLLDGNGVGGLVDNVTITIDDGFSPPTDLVLNSSMKQQVFLRDEVLFPGSDYFEYFGAWTDLQATDICGTVDIVCTIEYLIVEGPGLIFLDLRLDGELIGSTDVYRNVEGYVLYMAEFHHIQPIPSGPSLLNVTLTSYDANGTDEHVFDTYETTIFRVTDINDTEAAIDALEDQWTWLVVDPGVHLDLAGVSPSTSPFTGVHVLRMTPFEGSTIEVHDLDVQNLSIGVRGNGTLKVHSIDTDRIRIVAKGARLEMVDISCGDIYLDMTQSMTQMVRTTTSGKLEIYLVNSTLSVEDSVIVLVERQTRQGTYNGVLEVKDSTISGATPTPDQYNLTLAGRYSSTYSFEGVVFEDIVVVISQDDDTALKDLKVDVHNCTFTGETSVLAIVFYYNNGEYTLPHNISLGEVDIHISRNTFSGVRSGLVISHPYKDARVEDNVFSDGAMYYAQFFPDIWYERRAVSFINGEGVTTGPILGGVMIGRDPEVFVDTTENPERLSTPGELLIALRAGSYYWPDEILWFATIDPSSPPAWIPEVDWGPFDFQQFLKKRR